MQSEVKDITFSNWVRIEGQRVRLDDIPEDRRNDIINALIYRPLLTIPNAKVIRTA